jgi:hypothetical protein
MTVRSAVRATATSWVFRTVCLLTLNDIAARIAIPPDTLARAMAYGLEQPNSVEVSKIAGQAHRTGVITRAARAGLGLAPIRVTFPA